MVTLPALGLGTFTTALPDEESEGKIGQKKQSYDTRDVFSPGT
jgi:hypothetical protein